MAQEGGVFDTYEAVGNREELADIIYMISPQDTPMSTLIGRKGVATTHPEWQVDTLATPAKNAVHEGNAWVFTEFAPTSRVGNRTQIGEKPISISRTQENTDKAGRRSELARERRKKGVELRKDMEYSIVSNQASVAGNEGTPRELGGFRAWLTSNTSLGATGADGGFNSGTGVVDAATDGGLRAFTKDLLDDVLESTYTSGGEPNSIVLSPYNKRVFSGFASAAQLRSNQSQGEDQLTIFAGADTYVSDFGNLMVIPNRVMATDAGVARNVFVVTPDMADVGIFDDIQEHRAAKTADAEKRVLNVEFTLKMNNEAAHGVVADVFGLTAAT